MKIGDLVRCPPIRDSGVKSTWDLRPSYIGVIVGVYGHKVEVLGGSVVSWNGEKGRFTWDKADLTLV